MKKIKTIIIDDEKEAREGLAILLEKVEGIKVIGMAKNGLEAIEKINDLKADLIFLDIQMPGINGFEVLNSIDIKTKPYIIFVTAYDEYAIQAFEVRALDYLLKPFSDERFLDAVENAKKQIRIEHFHHMNSKIKSLILDYASQIQSDGRAEWVSKKEKIKDRFLIKHSGKVIFIYTADVIWIEADGYYIKIHTADRSYLVRKSMKQTMQYLPSDLFMRVHQSSIVNKKYIKEIEPHFNGEYFIELKNNQTIKVSRSYKQVVKDFIENQKF